MAPNSPVHSWNFWLRKEDSMIGEKTWTGRQSKILVSHVENSKYSGSMCGDELYLFLHRLDTWLVMVWCLVCRVHRSYGEGRRRSEWRWSTIHFPLFRGEHGLSHQHGSLPYLHFHSLRPLDALPSHHPGPRLPSHHSHPRTLRGTSIHFTLHNLHFRLFTL